LNGDPPHAKKQRKKSLDKTNGGEIARVRASLVQQNENLIERIRENLPGQ